MDLNRVKLCFEAFERDDNGLGNKLCEIYSCTIHESSKMMISDYAHFNYRANPDLLVCISGVQYMYVSII